MSCNKRGVVAGAFTAFVCIVLLGMSMHRTVLGQEFCSEPVAPYCVDTESGFDTMLQVNRCEDDLTDYAEQLEAYEQCTAEQIETMRGDLADAREKLEEARQDF